MIYSKSKFSKKTFKGSQKRKTYSYYTQKRKFVSIAAICLCAVLIPVVVSTAAKGSEAYILQKKEEIRLTQQENPVVEAIRKENMQGNNAPVSDDTLKASDINKETGETTSSSATAGVYTQTVQGEIVGTEPNNQPILESVPETPLNVPASPSLDQQTAPAPTQASDGVLAEATPQPTQASSGVLAEATAQPTQASSGVLAEATPQPTQASSGVLAEAAPTNDPAASATPNGVIAASEIAPSASPSPSPSGAVASPSPSPSATLPDANGVAVPSAEATPTSTNPIDAALQQASTLAQEKANFEAKIAQYVSADIKPEVTSPLVPEIQTRLMDLEYMQQDEPTELYGPATTNSIKYFQRKHELEVTGITDEATLRLLFSPEAKVYTVFLGAEGIDVEEIQKRLSELGYPVSVTGYFGTETQSAVEYFQRMEGLGVDGNVGSSTREELYSADAQRALESPASSSGSSSPKGNTGSSTADKIISIGKKYLGVPYILGAKGPNAFDCSGFVYYVLNESGFDIGYMTSAAWAQSSYETINGMDNLRRGDIICFKGHVGIYMGDGIMIDSVPSENGVRISTDIRNSSYWTKNFRYGKRIL